MGFSFDDLKYLVSVVGRDLLADDFSNLQDSEKSSSGDFPFSDEIYDKVKVLSSLLDELYKHRPLPF